MSGRELIAGRFKLLRKVGAGGMGDVWAARDVAAARQVALKVLRPERRGDENIAERFRHEAKIGSTLDHPNVTRVHELLEIEDGTLVLVMELLMGDTLRSFMRTRGALPSAEAVAILLPVLAGLQHAHDHSVVHRDLKPANIFLHLDLNGQMTPKLVDFGIAKSHDSSVHTETGDALGTPSFMSPEQVRAQPLDGRSDLFAIGTVLYEAIAGKNPFAAASPSAVLAQVLELEVDPDPKIDPRVWLELSRVLRKEPSERHASANELAKALTTAVGETPEVLERFLRRDPPPAATDVDGVMDAPTEVDALAGVKASEDAPTTKMSLFRRTRTRVLALVGAAMFGLIGSMLVIASIRRSEERAAAAAASASRSPIASDSVAEEEALEPPSASSATAEDEPRARSKPLPAHRPKPRPAPSTAPRGLGRTPGF